MMPQIDGSASSANILYQIPMFYHIIDGSLRSSKLHTFFFMGHPVHTYRYPKGEPTAGCHPSLLVNSLLSVGRFSGNCIHVAEMLGPYTDSDFENRWYSNFELGSQNCMFR